MLSDLSKLYGVKSWLVNENWQKSDGLIIDPLWKDRNSFLDAIGEMSQRFDIDIFAYVWWIIITTFLSEPDGPIWKRRCSGSAPLTSSGSIGVIIEATISFRVVTIAISLQMMPTCCIFLRAWSGFRTLISPMLKKRSCWAAMLNEFLVFNQRQNL